MNPKTRGAVSKCTPELIELAKKYTQVFKYQKDICAALDISEDSFANYCNPESPYYNSYFSDAIKKGAINRKANLLAGVQKAGQDPKYWTADAWLLEREDPEHYGNRLALAHSGGVAVDLAIAPEKLTEAAENILARLKNVSRETLPESEHGGTDKG